MVHEASKKLTERYLRIKYFNTTAKEFDGIIAERGHLIKENKTILAKYQDEKILSKARRALERHERVCRYLCVLRNEVALNETLRKVQPKKPNFVKITFEPDPPKKNPIEIEPICEYMLGLIEDGEPGR